MIYRYEVCGACDLNIPCSSCCRKFDDVPSLTIDGIWTAKWYKARSSGIYCYQCLNILEQGNIVFGLGLESERSEE